MLRNEMSVVRTNQNNIFWLLPLKKISRQKYAPQDGKAAEKGGIIMLIMKIEPFSLKNGQSRFIYAMYLLEVSRINMIVNNADPNCGTMLTAYSKLELNVR